MPYNYTSWVTALSNMLVVPADDVNFVSILPSVVDAAEQALQRDLDMIDTIVRDDTAGLTPNSRNFTLPQALGRFNILHGINVAADTTTSLANGAQRTQLVPLARDVMDVVWPSETPPYVNAVPINFAMVTSQLIIVGPAPSTNYQVEVIGQVNQVPLSVSNPTTLFTNNLPDLFLVATMKFGAAYLKNFGATADDPRSGVSWSALYDQIIQSERTQEFRRKFAASAWSALTPSPLAQPPRS